MYDQMVLLHPTPDCNTFLNEFKPNYLLLAQLSGLVHSTGFVIYGMPDKAVPSQSYGHIKYRLVKNTDGQSAQQMPTPQYFKDLTVQSYEFKSSVKSHMVVIHGVMPICFLWNPISTWLFHWNFVSSLSYSEWENCWDKLIDKCNDCACMSTQGAHFIDID